MAIIKPTADHIPILADISRRTFIESHGHSASKENIDEFVNGRYNQEEVARELSDPANIYHMIYHKDQPAGFSKIIYNSPYKNIAQQNVTKLERIYLLKEFLGFKLGAELFDFNLRLSKDNDQAGMWLYVWKENHRAISFYDKAGFKIVGEGDFRLTATHSNPNHIMFLEY
jgi:ribosomal protein S18 acetylase RimI-like enzyme